MVLTTIMLSLVNKWLSMLVKSEMGTSLVNLEAPTVYFKQDKQTTIDNQSLTEQDCCCC